MAAPDVWHRNLAFYLDDLCTEAAHPVAEPPLSPAQVERAMLGLGAEPAGPACDRRPLRGGAAQEDSVP
jgi:hypothetical protein